jgi:hypothetical protein
VSASTLRAAAALIRQRANATAAPHHPYSDKRVPLVTTTAEWQNECDNYLGGAMGAHCASWPPDVALAVADLIDTILKVGPVDGGAEWDATVNLARTYLGQSA